MNLNRSAGAYKRLLHGLLLVAIFAEAFLPGPPLEDDVDIAGDEGADVLALGCLDAVVLVLVVAKVQREYVGRGCPSLDGGEGPRLEDLLCLLVQPEDGVLGDAQKTRYQLVPALLLFLKATNKVCSHALGPGDFSSEKGNLSVF